MFKKYAHVNDENLVTGLYDLSGKVKRNDYIDVTDLKKQVEIGQVYNPVKKTFVNFKPKALTLTELKKQKQSDIKAQAKVQIEALEGESQWKVRKAEQRAVLSNDTSARDALYTAIENIRQASNEAELALSKLKTRAQIQAFVFKLAK
ncbi:hypothetical protein [Pseudoalteromonas denitrificans]|uniref:Colicin import membrane protein n=1 Tax=Pseudoalteromonas denitrificans DSM 6059 TaxID=1123010 RepID=A0A1I1QEY7_9GAMM|nr:hypothetical protein [Pseudoalteromonas denitrificans]SFD16680.1 hypothetical protein SAMN02745724_03724 [Pseudoalteromonas denitrificans DSM 6059]